MTQELDNVSNEQQEVMVSEQHEPVKETTSIFDSAIKKTKFEQRFRFIWNNRIVTGLTLFNITVLAPLALFSWSANLTGFFDFAVFNYVPWFVFIVLWALPYLTWLYSTITIPIKEGYTEKWDWSKSKKGRYKSAIYNLGTLHIMSWCAAAKYVVEYYGEYLTSIQINKHYSGIVLQDNLDSLILILFVAPLIFSGLAIFLQVRDYMINKDLLAEHFMKWEVPFFNRFAHQYEFDKCDVIVGYEFDTKKPIVLKEDRRYLHEAVVGATGSGKTSTTILLRIVQDLIKIATGVKMGLVLLEPKGDAVDDVLKLAKKLGIPDEKIKVIDPTKTWSVKYNPFSGDRATAATSFQGTLNALTADQDDFFKGQQNEAASSYTLLAKIRFGDSTNVIHIQQMFTDPRYLANIVEEVRAMITVGREKESLTPYESAELDSFEQVVNYFENEVLEYKTFRERDDIKPVLYPIGHKYAGMQLVENKKDKFVTGAKKYLNDIALNGLLKSLFLCADGEEYFDADEFLSEGGIVLVNTALAELDELSLMFGQFFIRQFQGAVFRRAKEDKEKNIERIPIFFYTDEFPLYANEAFERFLTLARSYKVGALIAMQSIAQLDAISVDYRKSVLGNTSNKTIFGRGPLEDNEYFSKDFGEMLVIEESTNESGSPITSEKQVWGYRLNAAKKEVPRFSTTVIKELPFKQMIVQVVDESNSLSVAKHAIGQFVHESPLVNRFMSVSENEIKSNKEDKAIPIEASMSLIGANISRAIENPSIMKEVSEQHSVLPESGMQQIQDLFGGDVPIPVANEISINDMLNETEPSSNVIPFRSKKAKVSAEPEIPTETEEVEFEAPPLEPPLADDLPMFEPPIIDTKEFEGEISKVGTVEQSIEQQTLFDGYVPAVQEQEKNHLKAKSRRNRKKGEGSSLPTGFEQTQLEIARETEVETPIGVSEELTAADLPLFGEGGDYEEPFTPLNEDSSFMEFESTATPPLNEASHTMSAAPLEQDMSIETKEVTATGDDKDSIKPDVDLHNGKAVEYTDGF